MSVLLVVRTVVLAQFRPVSMWLSYLDTVGENRLDRQTILLTALGQEESPTWPTIIVLIVIRFLHGRPFVL